MSIARCDPKSKNKKQKTKTKLRLCITFLFFFFSFFSFWVTPSDAQGLLLALHSRITPSGAWGTIWDARDRTWVGRVQGKRPTRCAISPAPLYVLRHGRP